MKRSKAPKKNRHSGKSNIYYAVKSENDIYYQMAAIFSAANKADRHLAKEVLSGFAADRLPEKFLENSL